MENHLVILHGYTGHKESFKKLISIIKENRPELKIHNLMLPGHGTNNAKNLSRAHTKDYVKFLEDKLEKIKANNPESKITIFAHSFGGVVSVLTMFNNPNLIDNFISLNIALWKVPLWMMFIGLFLPLIQIFKQWYYLDDRNKTELGNIKDILFAISKSYNKYRKLLPKHIIILGKDDNAINPDFSRHLNKINPNAQLIEIIDFNHLPGNDDNINWKKISKIILMELDHNQV